MRRATQDQHVAADVLRGLGLEFEAVLVESTGAVLDALLWAADFRHCCVGSPGSSHHRDCQTAAVLHRLNPNLWHEREIDRAWTAALHEDSWGES